MDKERKQILAQIPMYSSVVSSDHLGLDLRNRLLEGLPPFILKCYRTRIAGGANSSVKLNYTDDDGTCIAQLEPQKKALLLATMAPPRIRHSLPARSKAWKRLTSTLEIVDERGLIDGLRIIFSKFEEVKAIVDSGGRV